MSEPGSRRGRGHDAEGARRAILDAAEIVFAEHGFDGARIDAIAALAGYNKSLLFHYYQDKLGLYSAVLKDIDERGNAVSEEMWTLLKDQELTTDAKKFRAFLAAIVCVLFDFCVANPRVLRMLTWEAAESWQTISKIAGEFNKEDEEMLKQLFLKAREVGLVHADIDVESVFSLISTTIMGYLVFMPRLKPDLLEELKESHQAMARTREAMIVYVVHAVMPDPFASA